MEYIVPVQSNTLTVYTHALDCSSPDLCLPCGPPHILHQILQFAEAYFGEDKFGHFNIPVFVLREAPTVQPCRVVQQCDNVPSCTRPDLGKVWYLWRRGPAGTRTLPWIQPLVSLTHRSKIPGGSDFSEACTPNAVWKCPEVVARKNSSRVTSGKLCCDIAKTRSDISNVKKWSPITERLTMLMLQMLINTVKPTVYMQYNSSHSFTWDEIWDTMMIQADLCLGEARTGVHWVST